MCEAAQEAGFTRRQPPAEPPHRQPQYRMCPIELADDPLAHRIGVDCSHSPEIMLHHGFDVKLPPANQHGRRRIGKSPSALNRGGRLRTGVSSCIADDPNDTSGPSFHPQPALALCVFERIAQGSRKLPTRVAPIGPHTGG